MALPPKEVDRQTVVRCVDHVIRERRTWKVLASDSAKESMDIRPSTAVATEEKSYDVHCQNVRESIEVAGWAPFHYDRRIDGIAEPWRFYWLDRKRARHLAGQLPALAKTMKPGNKMPMMLQACGSLVLVSWIPEPNPSHDPKLVDVNEEHLAAASAAVQNLLLALEARGMGTYWSSGGALREWPVAETLGMSQQERLLAAVFVDDSQLECDYSEQKIPGKNLEKRSAASRWCVELHENDAAGS